MWWLVSNFLACFCCARDAFCYKLIAYCFFGHDNFKKKFSISLNSLYEVIIAEKIYWFAKISITSF